MIRIFLSLCIYWNIVSAAECGKDRGWSLGFWVDDSVDGYSTNDPPFAKLTYRDGNENEHVYPTDGTYTKLDNTPAELNGNTCTDWTGEGEGWDYFDFGFNTITEPWDVVYLKAGSSAAPGSDKVIIGGIQYIGRDGQVTKAEGGSLQYDSSVNCEVDGSMNSFAMADDEDFQCEYIAIRLCDSVPIVYRLESETDTIPNCVPTPSPTETPTGTLGCARLDIDGYLNGCSSVITTVFDAISTNADAITANSEAITSNGNAATANADAIRINADGITTNGNAATANADGIATNSEAITSNTDAITTDKGEFEVFKVEMNTALDEIANFNAAHAPIGAKIDDSGIEYASISFKDSVMFGLLSLNFALVIYVFCVLKAQNKRLKGGYSVTYNQDAYDDAQPLKI